MVVESTSRLPLGVTAVMLPELDFDEQIALCSELGVTHYVYRPRIIPEEHRNKPYGNWGKHKFDLTPQRLRDEGESLSKKLRGAGLIPFGTVPHATADDDEEALRLHFQGAAAAGCSRVRVAPPKYPDHVFDYGDYLTDAILHYRRVVELARPLGVKPVIEMHTNTSAAGAGLARLIVEKFDPAEIGLIFDLPNAALEGYLKPPLAVSVIEEWLDHCHVGGARRIDTERDEHGFQKNTGRMTSLVDSALDIPQWIDTLRQLKREVPLVIEDYTPDISGELRLRRTVEQLRRIV